MKRWLHPRKEPNLYSEELITEILKDLKFKDLSKREDFHENLERAANRFMKSKEKNAVKLTKAAQTRSLKELAKHLKKSKQAYIKISKISRSSIFRFYEGLRNCETEHSKEKDLIYDYATDEYILKPERIEHILEVLEKAALEAVQQRPVFIKRNKTILVLNWLWNFSDEWEECSDIKISEGRFEEGLDNPKYDSPAMRILEKIAAPLDITNSQIAEAIKMFREHKKTEIPFDPDDYFQEI